MQGRRPVDLCSGGVLWSCCVPFNVQASPAGVVSDPGELWNIFLITNVSHELLLFFLVAGSSFLIYDLIYKWSNSQEHFSTASLDTIDAFFFTHINNLFCVSLILQSVAKYTPGHLKLLAVVTLSLVKFLGKLLLSNGSILTKKLAVEEPSSTRNG